MTEENTESCVRNASSDCTVIDSPILFDDRISLRAKGVFVSIINQAQREDAISIQEIIDYSTENKCEVLAAVEELKVAGYLMFDGAA